MTITVINSEDLWGRSNNFQGPTLDDLVREIDPDYHQAVTWDVQDFSPVTVICHEDGGTISGYRHCVTTDEWSKTYIGNTQYVLTGTTEPENCSSYDDVSPCDQVFDSESELLSFLGQGLDHLDEPGTHTYWSQCEGPHCQLPEFWSYHQAHLCNSRSYVGDWSQSWWDVLVQPIWSFWWMVSRPFREDEWGTRPITTPEWWFDGFHQSRTHSWCGPVTPTESLNDYLRSYWESEHPRPRRPVGRRRRGSRSVNNQPTLVPV